MNAETEAPAEELQTCTTETGCRAGLRGAGAGQINGPVGVAADTSGNVYVVNRVNKRIDKFDSEGNLLLTWGGPGTGPGQFFGTKEWPGGTYIAISPAGLVYVGDENRIQIFDPEGVFQEEIDLPREGEVPGGAPEGKGLPGSLAFDPAGNLYFDFFHPGGEARLEGVFKYDGTSWSRFAQVYSPGALAAGAAGDVYVVGVTHETGPFGNSYEHIFIFDGAGAQQVPTKAEEDARREAEEHEEPLPPYLGEVPRFTIRGLASSGTTCRALGEEAEDIYATYEFSGGAENLLRAYGPPPNPEVCAPTEAPPSIVDQFASSVGSEAATVLAKINPHGLSTTTYFVQWGPARCSEGGCTNEQPLPPGTPLNSASNIPVATGGVSLAGLAPETTYHYRFVARSRFADGSEAEVRGVGGTVGVDGAEASFTTAPASGLAPRTNCSNQAFRIAASALLSDCRAYEMVSPVDKAGGEVFPLLNIEGLRASLDQSSLSGDRLTYSTFRAFGDAKASPYTVQYLASRGPAAWVSESISPRRGHSDGGAVGITSESEFKAFSADLCQSWLRLQFEPEPVLDPAAVPGFPNLYRRQGCGAAPPYEALTTVAPRRSQPSHYFPELQGTSADGRCAIFRVSEALTPEAPELETTNRPILYERCAGGLLRLVAILPNGSASPTASSAGTAATSSPFRGDQTSSVYHAFSTDGSRVYWSAGSERGGLFLRLNADQAPTATGSCRVSEPSRACTIPVSVGGEAEFWMASPDGARAIYSERESLYESTLGTEAGLPIAHSTLIAEGFKGLMGASEDAGRIYFASSDALASGAVAGEPNLYYREAGRSTVFVATLSQDDLLSGQQSVAFLAVAAWPYARAARVTSDGLHAAFASHASLTGFDNTDQASGEADAEVFVYDATNGSLICASCNPTGARPQGRNFGTGTDPAWAAALIPGWESQLYASRALSSDGTRLFFDSYDALLPRDTNGRADVYEWESAGSRQRCEELGAERYVATNAGCLTLISSGGGSRDSEFVDASPSGRDVFFATEASLLPQDPGQYDIYDAREGGGFPPLPAPPGTCQGEDCQRGSPAPSGQAPGTAGHGAGNPRSPKPFCGKGRHAVRRHGKGSKRAHRRGHKGRHSAQRRHGKHARANRAGKRHGKWRCVANRRYKKHRHHRRHGKPGKHGKRQGDGRSGR